MNVVPNTRPREASPGLTQSDIPERLADYQAGVQRLAAQRTRPTPPPERRKLGPGGDWVELTPEEVEERRSAPHRRADSPPAPQWIAAGAVLLSNKLLDKKDAPSPGEELGVPLDFALKEIVTNLIENDHSYQDAIDELSEANERRANETKALRDENAALKLQLAELKTSIAKLEGKQGVMEHRVERLVVDRKGDAGERGPQGVDGPPGPRGERGSRGERGQAAPAIIEWRPDPEAFTIQAVLADGSTGPMIALRSLFESYHNATSWIEDADLVEAAHESRQAAAQEAERSRWAR